jgi:hypothetical protein
LLPQRKTQIEQLICLVLLIAIPALWLFPVLTGTEMPLSAESALFHPPWQEARPAGLEPDQAPLLETQALRFYPWYRFIHESAEAGEWPIWYPLEGFGMPFLAAWRTRALSPFSLPVYFLPLEQALALSVLLKLAVAGWCAFYVARRFGLHPATALFTAVTFQLSGPVYLCSAFPVSDVMPWFPLLLLFGERLLLGQVRAWPAGAIAIALMALGGDPETLGAAILFLLLYLLFRRLRARYAAHAGVEAAGLALALAAGLGLAGVQIAPWAEYVMQSAPHEQTGPASLQLRDAAAAFAPHFIDPERQSAAPVLRMLYTGPAPLLLLALWIALRRFTGGELRRHVEALFLAALGLILLAAVPASLRESVPLLRYLRPRHFLIAHAFAFSFMTAAAAEEWNELNPEQCKAALSRLLVYVPLLWGLLFAGIVSSSLRTGIPCAADLMPAALTAVCLIVLLVVTLLKPNVRYTGYTLALLAALTMGWTLRADVQRTDRELVFPETAFVRSLSAMETRVSGSRSLREWPLAAHGIPQVYNPCGITLRRYRDFIDRTREFPLLLRRTGSQALLLTKEDIQGSFAAVRPALKIQEVYPSGAILFRDLDAQERSRMIYSGRQAEAPVPKKLDPDQPPLLENCALPPEDDGMRARASVVEDARTRVVVEIEETRPGLLVLADAWYPGWQARVDGKKAAVHPVDLIFRGVEIGEGAHRVVFEYDPFSLKIGLGITGVSLLFVLFGLYTLYARGYNAR